MLTCRTHSQADVFVGTSAGSPLYQDIREARRSVRLISPYLGAHLVEVLLGCQDRGVAVRAVVSNDGGNAADLARLLVVQSAAVDDRRFKVARNCTRLAVGLLIAAMGALTWSASVRAGVAAVAALLAGLLAIALLLFFRQLSIYVYSYRYRIDGLRIVPSPRCYPLGTRESAPPFVHAKLYVIDDRVAYLGSANFTTAGLFDNLEAMVRLTSPEAIAAVSRFIDDLIAGGGLPDYPPSLWARGFFREYRAVTASG